jgi:hypothetical protein
LAVEIGRQRFSDMTLAGCSEPAIMHQPEYPVHFVTATIKYERDTSVLGHFKVATNYHEPSASLTKFIKNSAIIAGAYGRERSNWGQVAAEVRLHADLSKFTLLSQPAACILLG